MSKALLKYLPNSLDSTKILKKIETQSTPLIRNSESKEVLIWCFTPKIHVMIFELPLLSTENWRKKLIEFLLP